MTDGKMICESVIVTTKVGEVKLAKPKPFDETRTKAEVILLLQFEKPAEAKKYEPGKSYNVVITEED